MYCDDKDVKEHGSFFLRPRNNFNQIGGDLIKVARVHSQGLYSTLSGVKVHLDKNSREKWIKVLFAVSVFLFFSVFSAYLNYNYCADADFPSTKPRLETPDQDYLLADQVNKLGISRANLLPTIVENILLAKILSSFQKSLYDQEPIILRC